MNRAYEQAEQVRIGFIGCGGVADLHNEAISKCSTARLVAVYDANEQNGGAKARAWGAQFRSAERIFQADDIDAVYVLTPMESHLNYAEQALRNGKHVLIEKPVSHDIEGIQRLIELQAETGTMCMPGHSYLYLPELARMMRLIKEGRIGQATSMFMSEIYKMPDARAKQYHGPSIEVLCHQIYLMQALLGEPQHVQAFAGSIRKELFPDGDEHVAVNAQFADGSLAHLYVSWANHDETSDPWTFKVKVWGTQGGMHFSRRDQVYGTDEEMREYALYQEMFDYETDYFVNRCILRGEQPLSTLQQAKRTMTIAEAVRRSFMNRTIETLRF